MNQSHLTLQEVKDFLRLDNDYSDSILDGLIQASYQYITQCTGLTLEEQAGIPLCKTISLFFIRLTYYPENIDSYRVRQVIDSLILSIKDVDLGSSNL